MEKYFYKKRLNVPLYGGYLNIIFSNDEKRIKNLFPEFYEEDDFAFAYFDDLKYKDEFFLVLNFNHFERKVYPSVVAHESLHCTNNILSDRGIMADFTNDEMITYLMDFIIDEVYKFAKKKNFKIEYD